MLVEDMAVATVANMLRSPIRADTLAFVLAADMVTILPDRHAVMHAMQGAHITRLAAVTGEVVTGEVVDTGEVVIGIRTMDIPGLVITVWATSIHITGITATHITDIIPGELSLPLRILALLGLKLRGHSLLS